jgi:hypothetical protein
MASLGLQFEQEMDKHYEIIENRHSDKIDELQDSCESDIKTVKDELNVTIDKM